MGVQIDVILNDSTGIDNPLDFPDLACLSKFTNKVGFGLGFDPDYETNYRIEFINLDIKCSVKKIVKNAQSMD